MFSLGFSTPLDLVYVIDTSKDSPSTWLSNLQQYISNDLKGYNVSNKGVRVSVVKYADVAKVVLPLKEGISKDRTINAVRSLTISKGTRKVDNALKVVNEKVLTTANGARSNAKKLVILFMTGKSDPESLSSIDKNAQVLKGNGATITVIGLGTDLRKTDIKDIGSSDDTSIVVPYDNLPNVMSFISGILSELSGKF